MVALSAIDFGNFITHPLMKPPSPPIIDGIVINDKELVFLKDNVCVEPTTGAVTFYGMYAGMTWEFDLQRADSGTGAAITARLAPQRDDDNNIISELDRKTEEMLADALSQTTSNFFNQMVFELDGTFLSFNDMMLTGKGKEPSVMLSLSITVKKFPSPGLEF
jgi:hypothetical protein